MPAACHIVIAPMCNTEGSMPFHNNITVPLKIKTPIAAIAITKGIFLTNIFFIKIIFRKAIPMNAAMETVFGNVQENRGGCG